MTQIRDFFRGLGGESETQACVHGAASDHQTARDHSGSQELPSRALFTHWNTSVNLHCALVDKNSFSERLRALSPKKPLKERFHISITPERHTKRKHRSQQKYVNRARDECSVNSKNWDEALYSTLYDGRPRPSKWAISAVRHRVDAVSYIRLGPTPVFKCDQAQEAISEPLHDSPSHVMGRKVCSSCSDCLSR